MKRILFIIMVLTLGLSIVACTPETERTPTAAAPTAPSAPMSALTSPSASEVLSGPTSDPTRSYTTGFEYDGEYKPVVVVIENSKEARPQTGLQTADVVYEMPVEGSITRFVCVFSDSVPEEVMPVRSGRVSFLYIQQEWDAVFMHWGGSGSGSSKSYTFYGNDLYNEIKIDVNGIRGGEWSDYYYRKSGVITEHNVVGNPLLAQELYDYEPEPLGWLFDGALSYSGDTVAEINLSFCSNMESFVSYTYDSGNDVYLRSMSGKAFASAETGEQVSVKNIIVQYSTYIRKASEGYKVWEMTGGGDADFYIGGVLIQGTWEKASATDPTIFRDADGNQIVLRPGNTWIHIHPEE